MRARHFQKSPISLEDGALFVADAHYQKGLREEFGAFLDELLLKPPPQLFLMGDIFDLLVGDIPSTIVMNEPVVTKLQKLSKMCECHYFEGNHDFNLRFVFPDMQVYLREAQPAIFIAKDKRVALSHGDLYVDKRYDRYIDLIRKGWVLKVLRLLNINDWIVREIQRYNASKNLCQRIENFENIIAQKRLHYPDVDLIVEGHFHQNYFSQSYINLPSFACGNFVVLYENSKFTLKSFDESLSDPNRSPITKASALSR